MKRIAIVLVPRRVGGFRISSGRPLCRPWNARDRPRPAQGPAATHGTLQLAAALGVQLAAFWPLGWWYVQRTLDPSDEPWGIFALGVGAFSLIRGRAHLPTGPRLWMPSAILLVYALTFAWTPPLIRAALAVTCLSITITDGRWNRPACLPSVGLLYLSLPVIPSLQFYLGYPLRRLVALLAAPLLRNMGLAVQPRGACLDWNGTLVAIDAPCSGIKMLWAACFLALCLAALTNLSARKALLMLVITLVAVLAANVLRCASLFFIETGRVAAPAWSHEGVGIAAFAILAASLFWCVHKLARREVPCAT